MNTTPVAGIHHITAFASDPQANADFYTKVLGLRLVKVTVNFDDPSTYHLYFGNNAASPGSILTFFPITSAAQGRRGSGEVTATAFAVPAGSLRFWQTHLAAQNVRTTTLPPRFGQAVLAFTDLDGTDLELIETDTLTHTPLSRIDHADVPPSAAITGFFGATLTVPAASRTADLLTELFGFRKVDTQGDRTRYVASSASNEPGRTIDIVRPAPASTHHRPVVGAGSVHHIALRAADEAAQAALSSILTAAGYHVTEQRDRCYFKSIYFRETGGVLFEIATDGPGFATDESPNTLGTSLKLPRWMEKSRKQIAQALPRITNISHYSESK